MFEGYEKFKKDIYAMTTIDLNAYKEKQMRRRIDSLLVKNKAQSYDEYVHLLHTDKEKFDQFINFLTINVSEFTGTRNSGSFGRRGFPGTYKTVWQQFENLECSVFYRR